MILVVDVIVVLFVASVFAAGFIVAMRDFDSLRAHVDHEERLDLLWDDGEAVPVVTVMPSGKAS